MTTRTLTAVAKAARKRADADNHYLETLRAARAEGHTFRAIGAAAGKTGQAIEWLLRHHTTPQEGDA